MVAMRLLPTSGRVCNDPQLTEETEMNRVAAAALSLILLAGPDLVGVGRSAMAEPTAVDPPGIIIVESAYDAQTTADRLVSAITAKGLEVFARIDHAAGAQSAGMELPPTELIIFGAAKVGTALMHCDRAVAIDLPLKALVWQNGDGKTLLGYNGAAWLARRHALADCGPVLEKVEQVLAGLAAEATE
jgi:uncharacterized protein (DUF302 family)